jgi:hypothetical protein
MDDIRDEYDFSDARPNPYNKRLKEQATTRLDVDPVDSRDGGYQEAVAQGEDGGHGVF